MRYPHFIEDPGTSLIWVTESAQKRLRQMREHLQEIRATYGEHSEQYATETASLVTCLLNLLTWGMDREQCVTAMLDGSPKDLIVDGGPITYGINWHRTGRGPQYEGFAEPGSWSCNS